MAAKAPTASELTGAAHEALLRQLDEKRARLKSIVQTNRPSEQELRAKSLSNLKQLAQALSSYLAAKKSFPPAAVTEPGGKAKYSWRVAILPYLPGGQELYAQYHLDEPWDSENNVQLIDRMPDVFRDPHVPHECTDACYFMPTGKGFMGSTDRGVMTKMVADGMTKTILLVEADRPIPWTEPKDIDIDPDAAAALPRFGGHFSPPKYFGIALADGSVKLISTAIEPAALRALLTYGGGERIDLDMQSVLLGEDTTGGAAAASSNRPAE